MTEPSETASLDAQVAPPLEAHVAPSVASPAPAIALVSTRGLIGAGFDLLGRTSADMRRASFYIGAIVLGTAGPVALATWAAEVVAVDRPPAEVAAMLDGVAGLALTVMVALACAGLIVAVVESRNIAAGILGGHLAGRPVTPRQALARSREVFWRAIVAAILVAIPLGIAQALVGGVLAPLDQTSGELSVLPTTLVTATIGAPFAYVLSGVVLGAVDPVEAVRRSFRVFRARKLAAAIIVVFETVSVLLIVFGVSAGLDIVIRVFAAVGLGPTAGPGGLAIITAAIVAAVFAFGTLVYTVYALTVAPQVVMFVGLTHATMGLDGVRTGGPNDPEAAATAGRRARVFTRPMLVGFAIGALALAVMVATVAG